jgi:hypothetical protein
MISQTARKRYGTTVPGIDPRRIFFAASAAKIS